MCNLQSLKKFASAYLFQIAREKLCDYLLVIYMKKFEKKRKKRTHINQSGKNCAIQGARLIWKEKIWLVLIKPDCLLANHNPEFRCVICTEMHCSLLSEHPTHIIINCWQWNLSSICNSNKTIIFDRATERWGCFWQIFICPRESKLSVRLTWTGV